MEISRTIHMTRLSGLSKTSYIKLQKTLAEIAYNQVDGYGFKDVTGGKRYVHSTLVKRTPTFIMQIEPESGELIEQEIFLFSSIDFGLDFNFETLEVFGAGKNTPKVISSLYPYLDNETRIEPTNLLLANVLDGLSKEAQIKIDRLVVSNFVHKEGIFGRFDMSIEDGKEASKIIKSYKSDISKVTISLRIPTLSEARANISAAGSLTIKSEESEFDEVLSYIKNKIFERVGK